MGAVEGMAIGAAAGVLGLRLVRGAVGKRGAEPELVGLFADGLVSFVVDLMLDSHLRRGGR